VAESGSTPFTYTWRYNGTNYPTGSSGSLLASNAGTYLVIVSNIAGSATSSNATLTLTNLPTGAPGTFEAIAAQITNGTGSVQLSLTGTAGATYTLEVSTNLTTWTPLATFAMTNGAVQYLDTTASNSPVRFYLLVSP
jgi:hypothetical protein